MSFDGRQKFETSFEMEDNGNLVKIQQRIPIRIEFENLSSEDNMKLAAGMMAVVNAKVKK